MQAVIAGVFVGGAGSRMGGVAKGLLEAPRGEGEGHGGDTLLDRWQRLLGDAGIRVLLVGRHPAYAAHARAASIEVLDDSPVGIGPLGGLVALLRRAGEGQALAFACDMPFVSRALVDRLLLAPPAPVVAPRREGKWEALCARYDARRVLPHALQQIAGARHSLQGVLDEARAVELALDPDQQRELHDWDTPGDRAYGLK